MKSAVLFLVSTSMNLIFPFCISNFSFSSPLRVWIFQQVRLLCNPFQPFLFLLRQLPIVQFEPLADKGHRSLFRVAVWAGGFFGGLQEIFQRIVLRDTEKIVLVGFPQVKGYLVYILLYHMAAKAVIVNVLGYVKDPDKKGHLLIDPETRWIIEKIFDLAVHGRGAASITRILVEEKVPTPGWLNFQRYGTFANIYAGAPEEKAYAWTIAQVKSILKEETYIGHSVHNKQTNISFKNKKKVRKPKEEWYRVENTHEAIISEDVFRQVQEQICNRRRRQKNGTTQIFSGLVKCADCGWSLAYGMNSQNKNPYAHYHCSKYGQGLHQCSMHYIRYDVLYAYVLSRLQYWSVLAQQDGDKLLKRLLNASDKERNTARKRQTAELKKAEKRKAEVDTLFAKMYEDWSAGRITEYNFNMLSEKYQGEQRELDVKIERLHEAMETAAQTAVDAEKWIGLMKQYVNPTELTAELLNTLIEKILVHEAVKSEDGSREQEVEIFYRFIGKIE
jgi:site-specific DNA recombinase